MPVEKPLILIVGRIGADAHGAALRKGLEDNGVGWFLRGCKP